jgi:aryl-alcohol dehydrogenase-like predicted oxidoreductase
MTPRRLGHSELEISPIIFGAWAAGGWFWGGADDQQSIAAIRAALDAGVTTIDTAPVYGQGHSEWIVGQAIQGRRDEVKLLTKVGLRWDATEGKRFFPGTMPDGTPFEIYRNMRATSVRQEVEDSLRRLGVDHIDLLQVHWPDPSMEVEDYMPLLGELVTEGKVGAIGVSNFNEQLLAQAQASLGTTPLASTQPRYSLLWRKTEQGILPWCREHGVGVICYSPMERGLLTGRITPDRSFPKSDGRATDPLFSIENRRHILGALETARAIADGHGCTLAQLSVAWVLHQPGVTAALVGARSPAQAIENAGAAEVHLTPEEAAGLAQLFGALALAS